MPAGCCTPRDAVLHRVMRSRATRAPLLLRQAIVGILKR